MPSPLGPLTLVASDAGLHQIRFGGASGPQASPCSARAGRVLDRAARQLAEYFAGKRSVFNLPLAWTGTPFQRRVWRALLDIPHGETRSYAQIARAIGHPHAFRAVGGANRANPWPIVVPCHRVLGSDGSLTGYSGKSRLPLKSRLLALESGQ